MILKTDALGWTLNAQVLCAFLALWLPKKVRVWLWSAVLPLAITAITLRWTAVHHPPMRNLFEAFLWPSKNCVSLFNILLNLSYRFLSGSFVKKVKSFILYFLS